jgi:hypothetical protein
MKLTCTTEQTEVELRRCAVNFCVLRFHALYSHPAQKAFFGTETIIYRNKGRCWTPPIVFFLEKNRPCRKLFPPIGYGKQLNELAPVHLAGTTTTCASPSMSCNRGLHAQYKPDGRSNAVVAGNRKKVHTSWADGTEMVEEYDLAADVLLSANSNFYMR